MALLINISGGPKGVNTLAGLVTVVAADASINAALVDTVEAGDLVAVRWFDLVDDDGNVVLAPASVELPGIGTGDDGLDAMTVADLTALAAAEGIDLGEAKKKAEIIEAIRAARTPKD